MVEPEPKPDPKDEDKGDQVRFTAGPQVWKYLGWLSRNTVLGKTEHEVAKQILIARLAEMRQESYRDPPNP